MDFLEFLCGLLESLELMDMLFDFVRWLCRAIHRGGRWMITPSAEPFGRPGVREGKRRFPEQRGMFHLSLTRRRRGKWRGASYVLR